MLALIVFWLTRDNGPGVPGRSRESRYRDHAPFGMVAVTFVGALGTLAICLFWPYMLPLVATPRQAAAPHSSLALMFLGAGAFVFPLMLVFTAINYTVGRSKSRPRAAIISMRSNRPTRSKRSLTGRAEVKGG